MGNRNWMRAREALLASDLIPGDLDRLYPICTPGASDSASFDEVLELLHLGGRIAAARGADDDPRGVGEPRRDGRRRARRSTSSTPSLMEPWDGPACVVFTDGTQIGAVLDRNGLRPSRYWVTDDGLVVLASEVGVLDIDPATVVRKGRLQPGRMFLVDTDEHRIIEDEEIKGELAAEHPVRRVAARRHRPLRRPPRPRAHRAHARLGDASPAGLRLHRGGAARSCSPRWPTPAPSRSARWAPTPRSRRSRDRPRLLFDYFAQLFAQVTNPPLDAIREELVTSLSGTIGPEANLLEPTPASCRQLVLPFPVVDQRRAGQDPAHQPRRRPARLRHPRLPRPVRRRGRRRGAGRPARRDLRRGVRGDRRRRPRSSCSPTGTPPPSSRRSRRCCSPAPCTTTWCGRRPAPRSAWSSRPATSARCTTSRCSIGYGAAAVNPYLAMESGRGPRPRRLLRRRRAREGRAATWSRRSARACSR